MRTSGLVSDVRFAARYLMRRSLVTAVAVATLAIGIGATTAMFSAVDGVLWRDLPYPAPGRLVAIWQTFPHWRGRPILENQWDRIALSYQEYTQVSALDWGFEGTGAAWWRQGVRLTGAGDPLEVSVARGSVSLLPLLGIQPAIGRWFLPGEEGESAPHVAVIPHGLWVSRFGGDPGVLGRTIDLDGRPFTITGVLSANFHLASISPFARDADQSAVWTPIGVSPGDLVENSQNYETIARVRPGVEVESLRAAVAQAIRRGRNPAEHDARLVSRRDAETSSARAPLFALFAAVAALLVITCGNLAALLVGEAALREREIRTRLALGADTARVIRQLVTESVALAMAGAAAGIPLAIAMTKGLIALAPFQLPRADSIALDWRSLAFTVAVTLVAGVASGLAPALTAGRSPALAAGGATRSVTGRRNTLQQVLIAGQIALSMVLLVAAALLTRTLALERATPPGFDVDRTLTVPLNGSAHDGGATDRGAAQRFYDDLIERVRTVPGVRAVTAAARIPIADSGGSWAISVDPTMKLSLASPSVQHDEVLPNYFELMKIPVLAGRVLEDTDRAGLPLVAVVNETMARQYWPRGPAVGKAFLAPNGGVRLVVGVVADIREGGLGKPAVATFYGSLRQIPRSTTRQSLLIRTEGDPLAAAADTRKAIWSIDASMPVGRMATMTAIVETSLAPERYRALLVGFFAAIAMTLTVVGIAGVAIRAVNARLRELCIRMAVGATAGSVMRLVVLRYLRAALGGLAAGTVVALLAMRLVATYLAGVTTTDPVTYAGGGGLLLGLVVLAGWLPARRLRAVKIANVLSGAS